MQLFYKKMGDKGPVIIILHGLFGNSRNWQSIAKVLSKQYQVYTLDLRNHGLSPHSNLMSYKAMVADIIEFKNTHHLSQFNLIGHSMGGKAAMLVALIYPKLVQHLAIVDIAPIVYQHDFADIFNALLSLPLDLIKSRKQAEQLLVSKIIQKQLRQFLLQNLSIDKHNEKPNYWHFNLQVLNDSMDQIIGFPTLSDDHKFTTKSLFVAGQDSNYINNDNRKVIKYYFPNSNIVKVKNAGHWLHAEQPEVLIKMLNSFLSSY